MVLDDLLQDWVDVSGVSCWRQPGLAGKCPGCGGVVVARCGEVRLHHWAHKGILTCDRWRESETEWHRAWKNQFPKAWQEVHHTAESGEKHIADVKTERDYIECQHSALSLDERASREAFYPNLVWIVHGRRLALDLERFKKALSDGIVILNNPRIVAVPSDCCPLLRNWRTSRVPVYFDFGENEPHDLLWRLSPGSQNGRSYLLAIGRGLFLNGHLEGQFHLEEECAQIMVKIMAPAVEHPSSVMQGTSQPQPLPRFQSQEETVALLSRLRRLSGRRGR